jgi:sugar transferase EpsL
MQARDFAKNQARYLAYRSRIDVSKGTPKDAIRASVKRRPQLGKRFFDLALALPGLVLLSPVITVAAVLTAIGVGWPILFRRQRPGLLGKPFVLIKFRTMTDARDANGTLKPDPARMPAIGRFLRMTSLDELPQLWNIIRGEMSLV